MSYARALIICLHATTMGIEFLLNAFSVGKISFRQMTVAAACSRLMATTKSRLSLFLLSLIQKRRETCACPRRNTIVECSQCIAVLPKQHFYNSQEHVVFFVFYLNELSNNISYDRFFFSIVPVTKAVIFTT
jgi:hypothetical protein